MAPSPGTRSSLTLENLQSIPTRNKSVEAFVNEQRQNTSYYVIEASERIDQPRTSATTASKPGPPAVPIIRTSPILKSRLEMSHESALEEATTSPIPKKSQPKELFKRFKHAREDTTSGNGNPVVTTAKRSREDEEHFARK